MHPKLTFEEVLDGLRANAGLRDFFRNQQRFLHLFLLAMGCEVDRNRLEEVLEVLGRASTPQTYYRLRGELEAEGWIEYRPSNSEGDGRDEVPHRVALGREREFLRNLVVTAASDRPVTISKYHLFELGLALARAPEEVSARDALASELAACLRTAGEAEDPTGYARESRFVFYPHFIVEQMAERVALPELGAEIADSPADPSVTERVLNETLALLRGCAFQVEAGLSRRGELAEVQATAVPGEDGWILTVACRARPPARVDFSSITVRMAAVEEGSVLTFLPRPLDSDGRAELAVPTPGLYQLVARRYSAGRVPIPEPAASRGARGADQTTTRRAVGAPRTLGTSTPSAVPRGGVPPAIAAPGGIEMAGARVDIWIRDAGDGAVEIVLETQSEALADATLTLGFVERGTDRYVAEASCTLTLQGNGRWGGSWSSRETKLAGPCELRLSNDP